MTYLIKIFLFSIFLTATYFAVDYMLEILQSYLVDIPFSGLLCQFGVLTGLNLYFSILITGYLFNQVLSFWK